MEHGLAAVTQRTITEPAKLYEELALIRKRGYAVANEELQDGVISVAAPILATDSRPVGSLSISAPEARMPERLWSDYGKKVREAADTIAGAAAPPR